MSFFSVLYVNPTSPLPLENHDTGNTQQTSTMVHNYHTLVNALSDEKILSCLNRVAKTHWCPKINQ